MLLSGLLPFVCRSPARMSPCFDQLEPTLLEKIITKLEGKSYLRLQQTCRWINDFIRKSKRISVYIDGFYQFDFTSRELSCDRQNLKNTTKVNLDSFYATRLRGAIIHEVSDDFDQHLNFLRENKITVERLCLYQNIGWTAERRAAFLKVTKVRRLDFLHGTWSTDESIFHAKNLKTVELSLKASQVLPALPKLLATFVEVGVQIQSNNNNYNLLQAILQILATASCPNLKNFQLATMIIGPLPSLDELKEHFLNQKWTAGKRYGQKEISTLVTMSPTRRYKILILDRGTRSRARHTYFIVGPEATRASRFCLF